MINTNGMIMNPNNMIIIPPLPVGRRKRKVSDNYSVIMLSEILKVWYRSLAVNNTCLSYIICQFNYKLSRYGKINSVIAELVSIYIIQSRKSAKFDILLAIQIGKRKFKNGKNSCASIFHKNVIVILLRNNCI